MQNLKCKLWNADQEPILCWDSHLIHWSKMFPRTSTVIIWSVPSASFLIVIHASCMDEKINIQLYKQRVSN